MTTKRRRKRRTDKTRTRWKCNKLRMRNWRRFWNEGGGKKVPCRRKSCTKVLELVVHERMSQGANARGTKEKKKVKGWSTGEMKDKPSSSW